MKLPSPFLFASALLLLGCAGPSSGRPVGRESGWADTATGATTGGIAGAYQELLDHHRYDDAIALVERNWDRADAGDERATLEWVRAQALAAQGQSRAATAAFGRARREVEDPGGALARGIQRAWGDADLAAGRPRQAARHYTEALESGDLPRREWDELCVSAVVALRSAGDGDADLWAARVRFPGAPHLKALESRLESSSSSLTSGWSSVESSGWTESTPSSHVAGSIPDDPGTLLPDILERSEWAAKPIRGDYDSMEPVYRITVHHTARTVAGSSTGAAQTELRAIQDMHQGGKGWADIGYHFVIDPGGRIWEGRQLQFQGAHAGGDSNRGNVGVCVMGNFEYQPLLLAQSRSLDRLLGVLRSRYSVPASQVFTHDDFKDTACPGRSLRRWMSTYVAGASTLAAQSSSRSASVASSAYSGS